eukprot:s211_g19.t1
MDGEQVAAVSMEWKVLKERFFAGEPVDPVFEGIVKDFIAFDVTLQDVFKKVEIFMHGVDSLSEGLTALAESTTTGLSAVDDQLIKADCCKMKEATNSITRADAPHSAIAKLRRDMDFNIMNPLRSHIVNNRNMKGHLDKRRRRLLELNIAKREMDECTKKHLNQTDRRYLSAQSQLDSAKMAFHEVDKHIFEWLYILEEYKGDILDSCLQTLKYLQYEFFATSAHAISGVLPVRMEFRPMVEMTPEHLEAQVEMALQEADEAVANDGSASPQVVTDFSARLIEKLAKDNKNKPGEGLDSAAGDSPAVPVDPLSLSSLLSQGFDEGPARQALRKFKNNTQAALDFLIGGGGEEEHEELQEMWSTKETCADETMREIAYPEQVRMPTTVPRVQRLKERRRAQQAQQRRKEEERRRSSSDATPAPSSPKKAVKETKAAEPADLLDFNHQEQKAAASTGGDMLAGVETEDTLPLPEQMTLDLSKCEKGPLPTPAAPAASSGWGFVHFKPGERVIIQGKVRRARQWYVIYAGTAIMKLDSEGNPTKELAEVRRPGCFGERSLLRGDAAYDVNVDAGPEGMTCLTFNGETIRMLLMRIYTESPGFIPDIHANIEEWCQLKARTYDADSPCHSMDLSTGLSQIQTSAGSKKTNLENLSKLQLLGRGAYGEVTLVEDMVRKRRYALKAMSKGHLQRKGVVRQIRWERELLSMVDSPFVIKLHRTLQDDQHIFFLMEAALGGNLMELLHTHSEVFLEDRPRGSACAFYVACLVAALEHLHERCIVHRHIKPENAMLDEQGYVKLCDMGFARFVLNKTNTLAGTPEYMAPEVIEYPHTHDSSVDWWALGVLTYELLSGQTPFYDEGIAEPMARMLAIRRSQEEAFNDGIFFPFHFPSSVRTFVQDLLQPCPETRCSGENVRCHSMYRHFDFSFEALLARRLRSPFVPDVRVPEADENDPDMSFSLEGDTELYRPCDRFKEESFV